MAHIHSMEAKIVVLGTQGVGKTSVVVRYVSQSFNKHVSPTIGASFFTCNMNLDGHRLKLQVWDTAGQERFRSMAPMYYRKANAALLVFDITSRESFDDIKNWVLELQKNVDTTLETVLLGNKCDMENDREISKAEAQEYSTSINAEYFETSALTNIGVDDVFLHIAHNLIKAHELRILNRNPVIESDTFMVKQSESSSEPVSLSGNRNGGCCS